MSNEIKDKLDKVFDLSTEPVLEALNEVKKFINENIKDMDEDELEFNNLQLDALQHQYDSECSNPLADRVLAIIGDTISVDKLNNMLDVLLCDDYVKLQEIVKDVMYDHMETIVDTFDSRITPEVKQLH